MKNGSVLVAPGDAVEPAPSTVSSVANLFKALNNHGNTAFRLALTGGPSPNGMYYNLMPFVLNGDIATAPQFSPNTPYIGFFRARLDDSERMFLVASVDDPNIPSSVDRGLVWFEPDGSGGWTEDALAIEGDVLPGMVGGESVGDFGTNYYSFKIDNSRNALFTVDIAGAGSSTNGAIYYNQTLLARKGDASPITGSTYTDIGGSTRTDMNDLGDYIFRANLSNLPAGENVAIIRNQLPAGGPDEVFLRLGDMAPGLSETVTGFGTGPSARINDAGDIVWFATLSGATANDQALFANGRLLMRKGVTMVGNDLITTIAGTTPTGGITRGFTSSQNGQFILTRCVLNGTTQAAVLIENGGSTPPTVTGAVSRKAHGVAGMFDIDLPLSGTPGIECRSGGATNDYTMVVTFANPVTIPGMPQAAVTSGAGTIGSNGSGNGGIVSINGNVVSIPLTNVGNAQTINVTLFGVSDGTNTGNVVIPMSRLLGDTTGNGAVSSADISQTKAQTGQTTNGSNFRADVNENGSISSADISLVKSASGTSLP